MSSGQEGKAVHRQSIFVSLAVVAIVVSPGRAQRLRPTWEQPTLHEIEWYTTAPEVVVLATKTELRGLSQEDGIERWRFEAEDLRGDRFHPIPWTARALISFPRESYRVQPVVALVDLTTGEVLWTTENAGLGVAFGAFLVPHENALLIHGKNVGAEHDVLVLAKMESGELVWSVDRPFDDWTPAIFGNGAQPPLFDTRESMLLFLNGQSVRKYRLTDGTLIWDAPVRRAQTTGLFGTAEADADDTEPFVPTLDSGYAPMVLSEDGRRFFVPHHDTVGAFSTYNGASRWLKPEALPGRPSQMERVPQGLLVRTTPEEHDESGLHWISLLDAQTGRELWRSPRREGSFLQKIFGTWTRSAPFVLDGERVLVVTDDELYAVTLETGQEQKLCDLEFEGSDHPFSLEIRGDTVLVTGNQNALWCDLDGNVRKRVHYDPADGIETGLEMLASAALLNLMDDVVFSRARISMHEDYGPAFEEMFRSYSATATGMNYIYILTESPHENQLVRIGKDDGEEHGRIPVTTDQPDYQICPYTSNLLWKSGERTISCFTF